MSSLMAVPRVHTVQLYTVMLGARNEQKEKQVSDLYYEANQIFSIRTFSCRAIMVQLPSARHAERDKHVSSLQIRACSHNLHLVFSNLIFASTQVHSAAAKL